MLEFERVDSKTQSLFRWHPWARDNEGNIPFEGASTPVTRIYATVTFGLPASHRLHDNLAPLVGRTGYLAFRLLHAHGITSYSYLLYSAFAGDGDQCWVDGTHIESLFDHVISSDLELRETGESGARIAFGLNCHRERSVANHKKRHKNEANEIMGMIDRLRQGVRAVIEIQKEGERCGNPGTGSSDTQEQQSRIRHILLEAVGDKCPCSPLLIQKILPRLVEMERRGREKPSDIEKKMRSLKDLNLEPKEAAEERARLRAALIKAEEEHNQWQQLLDEEVWQVPSYEEQDIYAIEWRIRKAG